MPGPPGSHAVLRQRLLTAAMLLPPVLALVLLAPTPWLAVAFAVVIVLAVDEWRVLVGLSGPGWRGAVAAVTGAALLVLYLAPPALLTAVMLAGTAWWLLALGLLLLYPGLPQRMLRLLVSPRGLPLACALTVLPAWAAILSLHRTYQGWGVLALLLVVWAADSCAYFAGRRFGRRKLAPAVSPGKTVEGLLAGLAGAALVLALVRHAIPHAAVPALLAVGVVVAAASVVGDLLESLIKRLTGAKDSGTLLPGHGGVLDRIDGLLAAAPAFVLMVGALA